MESISGSEMKKPARALLELTRRKRKICWMGSVIFLESEESEQEARKKHTTHEWKVKTVENEYEEQLSHEEDQRGSDESGAAQEMNDETQLQRR